jgi:hypothetical protein
LFALWGKYTKVPPVYFPVLKKATTRPLKVLLLIPTATASFERTASELHRADIWETTGKSGRVISGADFKTRPPAEQQAFKYALAYQTNMMNFYKNQR